MNPARWREIEALFEQVSGIEPSLRSAFLERATNGDAELREEVESLLRVDLAFGRAVEAAVQQQAEQLAADPDDPVDLRFDSWRVTGVIGRGGMGVVYRAERTDRQFEQQAAIKLVKRGMDTDAVLRRFRAERQILARLEHPNIARLIDGGVTESGLPYFVLEYIEGQPLLAYCNGAHLSIAQRLKLFREICTAVQYAHQNLVVHCDLKPGNIMVTAGGTPKLLDFGVARQLNPDRSTAQTATIARMLTPDYASRSRCAASP
jgi:serine/threonine protein kinase